MKTVAEYNAEAMRHLFPSPWAPAGVACNACGSEVERDTTAVLLTYPPQTRARCPSCGWAGTLFC